MTSPRREQQTDNSLPEAVEIVWRMHCGPVQSNGGAGLDPPDRLVPTSGPSRKPSRRRDERRRSVPAASFPVRYPGSSRATMNEGGCFVVLVARRQEAGIRPHRGNSTRFRVEERTVAWTTEVVGRLLRSTGRNNIAAIRTPRTDAPNPGARRKSSWRTKCMRVGSLNAATLS